MIKIGVTGEFFEMEREILLLQKINDLKLTGLYHPKNKKMEELATKYKIPFFNSPDIFVESCNAINIAGRVNEKSTFIKKVLKNSKHLLINFPTSYSKDFLKYLIKLASEAKVIMQIRNPFKFNAAFQACLPYIKKPSVIDMRMEIKHESKLDHQLVSCIDLIRDMARSNSRKINATGLPVAGRNIDYITTRLDFENGSIVNLTLDQINSGDSFNVNIYQPGKRLYVNFPKSEFFIENIPYSLFPGNKENNRKQIQPVLCKTDPKIEELKHFRNSIKRKSSASLDIEQATQSLEIYKDIVEKINKTTLHPTHF